MVMIRSLMRLGFCAIVASVLLSEMPAIAQVSIKSTGVVNATIAPPNKNPNFNQGTTRIDVNSQGQYIRNGSVVFTAPSPNLIGVNKNGGFYVDFRGIPVVSTNGALTSAVLSNGQLTPIKRFNNDALVRFYGTIQDEFVVLGQYTGTVTNPANGNQYQGTFAIRGQGPRYSDKNGGSSPTVFDFKSYYSPTSPAKPTVFSYPVKNMPVNLTITVPVGLNPVSTTSPTTGLPTPSPMQPPIIGTTGGATGGATDSNGNDRGDFAILNSTSFFEVNRVVLEGSRQDAKAIGPRSRILLR